MGVSHVSNAQNKPSCEHLLVAQYKASQETVYCKMVLKPAHYRFHRVAMSCKPVPYACGVRNWEHCKCYWSAVGGVADGGCPRVILKQVKRRTPPRSVKPLRKQACVAVLPRCPLEALPTRRIVLTSFST